MLELYNGAYKRLMLVNLFLHMLIQDYGWLIIEDFIVIWIPLFSHKLSAR